MDGWMDIYIYSNSDQLTDLLCEDVCKRRMRSRRRRPNRPGDGNISFSKGRVIVKADAKKRGTKRTPWADNDVHQCLRLDCSTAEDFANPPQTNTCRTHRLPRRKGSHKLT
ncbi:hypothetical protein PoB_001161400 [Plakobranchus ocellatus]|uniref:Protein Wnt n=1 Tax=Plakobranchus ocellatus TaxID=259542 RepID=A0AAV3YQ10_9GAST|nr:hypothetical protein PoB_001161400 [Plakobranchus ocellatus]